MGSIFKTLQNVRAYASMAVEILDIILGKMPKPDVEVKEVIIKEKEEHV